MADTQTARSAFDLFQEATCQIGKGDRIGAAASLQKAIDQIDRDGVDAEVRADLVSLRAKVLRNAVAA